MLKLPIRIHVVGICGVAMSALAIALHEAGATVTGSDKGFFPPVSTELEKHGISFYAGWHPDKMVLQGNPDFVIVGTASGSQNPETQYATANRIPIFSYPEVIGQYFAQRRSIVCAGTWGKTSSSALLSYIFTQAGMDPSYMFGGISLSHDTSAKLTRSSWSVFEGDEYKSSPSDSRAKFFHYKATDLLLTAVSWDHADLYATEADYETAFKKLVKNLPEPAIVVGCGDQQTVLRVLSAFPGKIIWYGRERKQLNVFPPIMYAYKNVTQTKSGLDLTVTWREQEWNIHSDMLGLYQVENITGCFAMAHEVGIPPETIVAAIASFKGLKRRLEKRHDGDIVVFDDIAHSPEKASVVLNTLRSVYDGKVIAVFEPNIGGRERSAAAKYDGAFAEADLVIIPRLTKLKIAVDGSPTPIDGQELTDIIRTTQPNTEYIDDDTALVQKIRDTAQKGDVVVFLGSHGFRGMIEEVITELTKS